MTGLKQHNAATFAVLLDKLTHTRLLQIKYLFLGHVCKKEENILLLNILIKHPKCTFFVI